MDVATILREQLQPGDDDYALTSTVKLARLLVLAQTYRPSSGTEAMALLAVRPLLSRVQLPEDPREADALLDVGIELLRALQSDPGSLPDTPAPADADADAQEADDDE